MTAAGSPPKIAVRGMGADLRRNCASSGSCGSPLRINIPGWPSVCLSPRFYPHWFGPAGPLQDGVPRIGGVLLSQRRSHWTKTQNAVSPIATVVLHFGASQLPPFSTLRFVPMTRLVPARLFRWYGSPPLSYATFLLWRSGSYASPVTHNRCNSTDSFRATAITARFLAFLPPRSQIRSPNRRKSLSVPCGPNM